MRNWWTTLYDCTERGWATFSEIADTIPEGTPAIELEKALAVAEALNISFVSNVEGLPTEQGIREMLEWKKQMTEPEFVEEPSGLEAEEELEEATI